jgi:hypothetical protein
MIAVSITLRQIGPAVSWLCAMGMTPARLVSPTVGLMPTTPLTLEERKRYAAMAVELFRQVAVNQASGYDLRPADRAIRQALKFDELAKAAIEIVSRLPGREGQVDLAGLVLDDKRSVELRSYAAENLIQHIQRYGPALSAGQVNSLDSLAATEKEWAFRGRVADIVGVVRGDPKNTGVRLRGYFPPVALPAKAPAEKPAAPPEKEKDADKDRNSN